MDSDDEQHVVGGAEEGNIEIYLRIKPTANPTKKLEYDVAAGKVEFHVPRDATGGLINNTRENYEFTFNGVFPPDCSQEAVFNKVCRRAVLGCLDGYNGTVFAYGQTGSGKTFTVSGGTARYADRGLVPRALELLFSELAARTASGLLAPSGSAVRVSYLEIYNEQCYDLLGGDSSPPSLDVGQGTRGGYDSLPRVGLYEDEGGGLVLRGLGQHPAESGEEALQLLFRGESARAVAETAMNASSSRSHAAFCVHVETRPADGRDAVRRAKLYIVDLAGSERVAKTGTEGTSLAVESRHINLSLSYLEQVIVALQERAAGLERPHVPYRNSCLTSVLRDSLGGNCRTAMVATVAALAGSVEEGVATCRFAQRVAMISNAARVNEDTDAPALIARLRAELRDARAELRLARGLAAEEAGGGGGDPGGGGAAAGAPQPPAPQLSAEELARVADAAAAYVAAAGDAAAAGGGPPQPPQPPAFGGSLPRLRALLAALRAIARGEAPAGADGGAGGGGAGGGGGDAAAGPPVGGAAPGPAAAQAGRGATPPAPPGPELAQRDAELRALLSLLHGAALQPAAAAGEGGGGDGEAEAAAAAAAAAAASSEPPPLSLRCAHLLLAGAPAPAPPGGAAAAAGLGPGGCGCGGGDAAHALARRVAAFAAFRRSARRAAALRLRLSADLSAASAEAAGCAAAANAARGRIAAAAADAARRAAQAAAAAASGDAAWAASATAAAAAAADEGAAARGAYGEAASGLAAARGRAADARRALGDAAARAQADLDAWLAAAGWPGPGWAAAPAPAGDAAVVAGEEGDGVDGEGVAGAGAAGAGAAGAAADDGAARAGAGWGGWPAAAAAAAGQPPAWPPAQAAAPAAPQPPRAASVLLLAALGLGPSPGGGGPDAEPPLPPPPPPPPAAASAPLCGDAQADDDIRAFFAARERLAAAAR